MTVRELLQTCRDEKHEIIILEEKRDTLRASLLPKAIRPQKAMVQTSPMNTFDNVQAAIFDLNMAIDRLESKNNMTCRRGMCEIKKLNISNKGKRFLIIYYLEYNYNRERRALNTLKDVAIKMRYSKKAISRIKKDTDFFISRVESTPRM